MQQDLHPIVNVPTFRSNGMYSNVVQIICPTCVVHLTLDALVCVVP